MTVIQGKLVDGQSRCVHWHSPLDVIALKFKCCEQYYACYSCHDELTTHLVERYDILKNKDEKVIICGVCKTELTFEDYSVGDNCETDLSCRNCEAKFNPGCKLHYDLYFKTV